MMAFEKPYPPNPITYTHYDSLVDALEARFGSGASGYIKDRTQVVNSRGNIWDFNPGSVQLAIDDVNTDTGGAVWLPKGKVTETQPWLVDEAYPVHIHGSGMCWHDQDYGTMVRFNVSNGVHCVEIGKLGEVSHFGGLYDMTLYGGTGDRDMVHLDGVSDWHMERVYMNQAKRHGLNVESTEDSWNLWVKDNLIENCAGAGIRLEGGVGSGVILKSYFLNNYFYANDLDIELGALDGTTGSVKLLQFHNNQHFNTTGIGFKAYRKAQAIICNGHIFYETGGDAIDINDDGAGNKCSRININSFIIDGQSTTPNGIDLQGYTDHVIIDGGQVYGVTGTAIVEGGNTTNITKGDLHES